MCRLLIGGLVMGMAVVARWCCTKDLRLVLARWFGTLAIAIGAAQAMAQAQPEAADAPARVPYLIHLDGAANVADPRSPGLWQGVELGRPLRMGERFWLSTAARAEFSLGPSSSMRLLGEARVDLTRLDSRTLQLALTDGRVIVRVRNLWRGERVEIDMPNFAVVVEQSGDYRFEVDAARSVSRVAIAQGAVTLWGEGGERAEIAAGQQFAGTGRRLTPVSGQDVARGDALDRYAFDRDQALIAATRGYSPIDYGSVSSSVPPPAPIAAPPILLPPAAVYGAAAPVLTPPAPVVLVPPMWPPGPPVVHVHPRPIIVAPPSHHHPPPHAGWRHPPPHAGAWPQPPHHGNPGHGPGWQRDPAPPGFGHNQPRPPAPQTPQPIPGNASPIPGIAPAPQPFRQMRPGGPGGEVGRPFSHRHDHPGTQRPWHQRG